MNKKQLFNKIDETQAKGSIRKVKWAKGAVATVALAGAGVVALAGTNASADEVTAPTTSTATEVVSQPVVEEASTQPTSTIPTSVPATTTQDQAVQAVDSAQTTLKDNVTAATEAGVVVTEESTREVTINDSNAAEQTSNVLADLNNQDQAVLEATEKAKANTEAYETAKSERETAISEGETALADSAAKQDEVIAEGEKINAKITGTESKLSPEFVPVEGLEGQALTEAMSKNLELYNQAVKDGIATQDASTKAMKAKIDAYLADVATYNANTKVYNQAKSDIESAVAQGTKALADSKAAQDAVVKQATDNDVDITTNTTTSTPKYVSFDGLQGEDLKKAVATNIALYDKAVKDGIATQDASTQAMKAKLSKYLKELADYHAGIGINTGLKWQNGVTLTAGVGAQKMTGAEQVVNFADGTLKSAAKYATQSNDLNQNTDANFNNIFKINGSGTIYVKNTTNGDVTLTFSEINSPGHTGTYVAIWGAADGGIAWSVFATYTGGAVGGVGEAAGGGTGIGGAILNYIYSYKVKAVTANGVSVVTFNDIDNKQTIKVSGLDGATIEKGKNVTGSGNTYSAGVGDKSQASSGKLDSNGVGWTFDNAKKQDFTVVHSVDGKNTSIVGGIFGVASEKPKVPSKPADLVAEVVKVAIPENPEAPQKPSTPELTYERVSVDVPEEPTAPKPTEVSVHYYEMTKTPPATPQTPQTPQNSPTTPQETLKKVLPNTGEKSNIALASLGIAMLGLAGISLRKKNQ